MVNITTHRTPSHSRYLPLRHAKRILSRSSAAATSSYEPEALSPGEEQLYSFYIPSLPAGAHTITTTQRVTVPSDRPLKLLGKQEFTVVAPQYSLPDGSIHSVYPPQGHADNVEILPHVVLNDSHLPWERIASKLKEKDFERNRVPWLAVLVFTQEELRITDQTVWEATSLPKPVQQSTTLAVNMSLSDLSKVRCTTPIKDTDPETNADFIFVKKALFNTLTTDYELDDNQTQTNCSVSRYKWLAHMRNINTTGMANSGIDDDLGTFSIVISHRTGPLSITQPTPVVVHLVSIENIEKMDFPVMDELVGLCSLDSWSYTCLPPNSLNVPDAMAHLGATLDVLRADKDTISRLLEPTQPPQAKRIAERLNDGYTVTQYRAQTGETCAALLRGPFAPTTVKRELKPLSNFGTDLQVMDKEVGVMDLTYSVAWQLGKTLALADQSFATALGRIRMGVHREALQNAKAEALREVGGFRTMDETFQRLSRDMDALRGLSPQRLGRGPVLRWMKQQQPLLDLAFDSDLIEPHFHKHAAPLTAKLASATDGNIYNELNTHFSSDWMVVLSWVLDRMYLCGIPAHYLIPDPSHLPIESLRFFHIDANWVDALIDGALSLSNQMSDDDDKIRTEIKNAINRYLETPITGLDYCPQVPTHGFLLRSDLCTKFPDLIVEAPVQGTLHHGAPILRQENIDEGVMLALFDRVPGGENFQSLIFRQPPHQQSFAAGRALNTEELETAYKRIYTIPNPPTGPERTEPIYIGTCKRLDPESPKSIFVWGDKIKNDVRTLRLPQWAEDVYETLRREMPDDFQEDLPTAALVGIQLNNPMYFLEILDKSRDPPPQLKALGDSGPRTLSMLRPRFKRAPKAKVTFSIEPKYKEKAYIDTLMPLPSPKDRMLSSRYRQQLSQPPPNMRCISTVELDPSPETQAEAAPAGKPKFTYKVYGIGSKDSVTMHPNLPQDLVFSILLKADSGHQYELEELGISIPMGPVKDERKNLCVNYRGPGSVMLSNLRFNVIPTRVKSNLYMQLLPRSTEKSVGLSKLKELCFTLNGVVVNEYDKDVVIRTEILEKYRGMPIRSKEALVISLVRESGNTAEITGGHVGTLAQRM